MGSSYRVGDTEFSGSVECFSGIALVSGLVERESGSGKGEEFILEWLIIIYVMAHNNLGNDSCLRAERCR